MSSSPPYLHHGKVERKNRTLIEAARTMLADSLFPITFWAEAVNTACYVLNRALVKKLHNKTPYELLNGRSPRLDFLRSFGCPVTILNTLDPLGKFKGKADEGFLVGYSVTSKAFRVFNTKTKKVEENLHGIKPTKIQVYKILMAMQSSDDKAEDDKPKDDTSSKTVVKPVNKEDQAYRDELDRLMSQEKEASDVVDFLSKEFKQRCMDQRGAAKADSTNSFYTVSNLVNAVSTSGTFSVGGPSSPHPNAFIPDDTLLHMEPKRVAQSLDDESWVEAMQDELLQLCLQKNKKDERGIIVRNKARLVAQGHKQEEGIEYDEVFAPAAKIEAIMIFLTFASFMGFIVYHMDVKRSFLYGTIEEEVYVSQPPGFIDPQFPNKVYKVEKALYGLHQAPRACFNELKILDEFHEGAYFLLRTVASTPIETQKPLVKDEEAANMDVQLYRSMIRSLI
uniref:Retrovirus-related Pol polyprotein from transposon TNT 1-94 n=1 Tax=Tanacetum cinerariifolium TaxID=118510 RepID=A0A6L2NHI8_TANCI|nr:retrovirus-related Pol polyprotein from transposon TNT 1-94 [Tanacetum cinerariifolium]